MDLTNAQPTILGAYLSEIYGNDFDTQFLNDTKNGVFYERIMEKAKELNIEFDITWNRDLNMKTKKFFNNRKHVKTLCYQNIFFNQEKTTNVFKIFTQLYPQTWRLLNLELSTDITLAKLLQNREASIFLNIKPNCNYFTVHDAIYIQDACQESYVINKVKELIGNSNFKLDYNFNEQDKRRINYSITIDKSSDYSIFIVEDVSNRKPHKQHSNSNEQEIKDLIDKGMKSSEIIKQLGISRKTYYKYNR